MCRLSVEIIKERLRIKKPMIKLLSKEVKSATDRFNFYCSDCKYHFKTNLYRVLRSSTCCSKVSKEKGPSNKFSIKDINEFLLKNSPQITLLSEEYKNCFKKMKWHCGGCNKSFHSAWANLMRAGQPCSNCSVSKPYTLSSIKNFIKKHNITVRPLFKNSDYKWAGNLYLWECCKCNHQWRATWNSINTFKSNCLKCSKVARWDMGRIEKHIVDKNLQIKPLFKELTGGVKSKQKWLCLLCDQGFTQNWDHIFHQGVSCRCQTLNKTERRVRLFIEKVFGEKFTKVRPEWLRSPHTNFPLEIDLYSEKLNLAIEVNGAQHYKDINFFYKGKVDGFKKRVVIDRFKSKTIRSRKINLVVIKIPPGPLSFKKLKEQTILSFAEANVSLPKKVHSLTV